MDIKNQHNFVYDLLFGTHVDDLNYIYRGEFNSDISNYILSLAERNIIHSKIKGRTKKRVFHIMVESIQNITRHQDFSDESLSQTAFFAIQKNGSKFYITTGNIINNEEIHSLQDKLEKLNNLSEGELTKFYLEILNDGHISTKGGAGLGLIEIVRKSGNKLDYDFTEISEDKSFIYMHSYVETDPDAAKMNSIADIYTFDYVKNLHKQIINENILILYCNLFEQDSLVRLISILKSQKYSDIAFKKRIISSMVELLQNIILHGKLSIQDKNYSPGIFYISKKRNIFYLNTVNYIPNEDTENINKKLEELNTLDKPKLEKAYNKQLFNFSEEGQHAGLGFIEMRLKSKNKLIYSFEKVDEKYSLFNLKLTFIDN
ncbi:MAG: SiaB family protein kinase [Bacteroidales bacterium]|nr:SiaB family protein kinase [Bacteroidales bacterium]